MTHAESAAHAEVQAGVHAHPHEVVEVIDPIHDVAVEVEISKSDVVDYDAPKDDGQVVPENQEASIIDDLPDEQVDPEDAGDDEADANGEAEQADALD